MRSLALASLLLLSCGPGDETNRAPDLVLALSDRAQPLANIALASSGESACSARWNGEGVTRDQLLDRSVAAVEGAVARAGGIQNITEETVPTLRIEAPAEMRFICLRSMLDVIERAGIPKVALVPLGDSREPAFADFPLTDIGTDTASYVVNISPAGVLTWNGEATDIAGLRTHARSIATVSGAPPAPGEVAVVPDGAAPFVSLYEALRALGQAGVSPMLAPPSASPPPPR